MCLKRYVVVWWVLEIRLFIKHAILWGSHVKGGGVSGILQYIRLNNGDSQWEDFFDLLTNKSLSFWRDRWVSTWFTCQGHSKTWQDVLLTWRQFLYAFSYSSFVPLSCAGSAIPRRWEVRRDHLSPVILRIVVSFSGKVRCAPTGDTSLI